MFVILLLLKQMKETAYIKILLRELVIGEKLISYDVCESLWMWFKDKLNPHVMCVTKIS